MDHRGVVGGRVQAKAVHVTNLAECARRFGSNAKTAVVFGTVVEVLVNQTATGRSQRVVVADYDFGNNVVKRKAINIRSLKNAPPDPLLPPPAAPPAENQDISQETEPTDATAPPELRGTITERTEEPGGAATAAVGGAAQAQDDWWGDSTDSDVNEEAANCHGVAWYKDNAKTLVDINGPYQQREWSLRTPVEGVSIVPGCDIQRRHSRLEYFLMMFPPAQFNLMHRLTNEQLEKLGVLHNVHYKAMSKGELLKFVGVLILTTRFEFGCRASLWSTTAPYKYVPAPQFGKTGMPRHRFDTILRCLRFSDQPPVRQEGMSAERYRWMLVDDFVGNFNLHRAVTFSPSSHICVDESMSRWYGLGGNWINIGIPHYVAIDRKPDNGCEIQNAACGMSGVMIRLKLVKSAEEIAAAEAEGEQGPEGIAHGTKICKELVEPWRRSDRVVCADSYFASVSTAMELREIGLRFIGVVKTATKKFPMAYLSGLRMNDRGERRGVISEDDDGDPIMMAFVWVDRDRRYFITTCSSLEEGRPYVRHRWRQIAEGDADAERVELVVPTPKCCEIYYDTCAAIDQNNRHRQDTLKLERKVETKDWSTRVNCSILGMCIVDSWLVFNGATRTSNDGESQQQFYNYLAEELIDNTYDDGSVTRNRGTNGSNASPELLNRRTGSGRSGLQVHLTPTKRKRRRMTGEVTNHSMQGRCRVCGMKTKYVCSSCDDEAAEASTEQNAPTMWLCHSETGRLCFPEHVTDNH
jgi:hypothetical protein